MSQDALKYSLQALAQPAEFQHRLLSVWLDPPAELPERFVQAHRHILAQSISLTKSQTDAIGALHAKFQSFCGLARACLETFGWPVEQPPLDSKSYGEDC